MLKREWKETKKKEKENPSSFLSSFFFLFCPFYYGGNPLPPRTLVGFSERAVADVQTVAGPRTRRILSEPEASRPSLQRLVLLFITLHSLHHILNKSINKK